MSALTPIARLAAGFVGWAVLVAGAGAAHAGSAAPRADEVCAGVGITFARPAVVEWTDWVSVGGGARRGGVLDLGAGGGMDFELAKFGGRGRGGEGPFELRAGPWASGETHLDGTYVVEAGASLNLGHTYHAQWGTFGLRLGGGATAVSGAWHPSGSFTLTYGVRSVLARYSDGGGCVVGGGVDITDPGAPRATFAHASGVRLFATGRMDATGAGTLLFGVEIEPTFLLPPYSLGRLIGGHPD